MSGDLLTSEHAAVAIGCSTQHVRKLARQLGVGINIGGRSGWKFTPAEVMAMRESMRPAAVPPARRRRARAS